MPVTLSSLIAFGLLPIAKMAYLPALLPRATDMWSNRDSDYILFAGSLTFYPNYYSIMWFLKNVWTKFNKMCPNLKLKITGATTEKIKEVRGTAYNSSLFFIPPL